MSEPNDHEWILLRERGEDVSHVPEKTRAKYERLAQLFEALPGATPSPGWKHRVFAALDDPPAHDVVAEPFEPPAHTRAKPGRPTCRRTWAIVGGLATAAAFGLLVVPRIVVTNNGGPRVTALAVATDSVSIEIRRGGEIHRSGSESIDASRGDTLVLEAKADRPFELRIYGDTGEPLARCTETQGCTVERDGNVRRFRLELELQAPGDVRAVLFTGASIPTGFQSLDADLETAQRANVKTQQIAFVHVQ